METIVFPYSGDCFPSVKRHHSGGIPVPKFPWLASLLWGLYLLGNNMLWYPFLSLFFLPGYFWHLSLKGIRKMREMIKSFENGLKSIPYSVGDTCLVFWLPSAQYVLRQSKKYGISFIKGRGSRAHPVPWSTYCKFLWVSGSNFSFSVNFRCLVSFHLWMIMDFSGQLGMTILEAVI